MKPLDILSCCKLTYAKTFALVESFDPFKGGDVSGVICDRSMEEVLLMSLPAEKLDLDHARLQRAGHDLDSEKLKQTFRLLGYRVSNWPQVCTASNLGCSELLTT